MGALAQTGRPLSFEDLAAVAAPTCRVSDVVAWIAAALRGGIIADAGFAAGPDGRPSGPRRYTLSPEGRRRLGADRRRG
jgi:hypothetical protein